MRFVELIVKLLALALMGASVAPLGARLWWVLDLPSHFRLQYVAAALLLIAVLAARKRFAWCAALAVCGAISAAPLLPYLPATASAAAVAPGSTVKLMAANLYFRNRDAHLLIDTVRAESPDVIVFVEFTAGWAQSLRELRQTYPYRIERSDRGAYGVAVYSRHELHDITPFVLGRSLAIEAKVSSPAGVFTLIGVHLRSPTSGWRAGSRNWQLDQLAARRATISGPLVLAGDFNVTPYSTFFSSWLTATDLTDSRRGRTLSPSWPTYLPLLGIPIDHVVVSDEVRVSSHRRLPPFGSDHYPVLAEFTVTTP